VLIRMGDRRQPCLRVLGVAQQIVDDLPQLVASPQTGGKSGGELGGSRARRLVEAEHLANQGVEIERRVPAPACARSRENR
jgi:geranylgeranyl pyrophosphate synthase